MRRLLKQLLRKIIVASVLSVAAGCTAYPSKPGLTSVTGHAATDCPEGHWSGNLFSSRDGELRGELDLSVNGKLLTASLRLYKPEFHLLSRTVQFQAVYDPVSGDLAAGPSPSLQSVRAVFAPNHGELVGFAIDTRGVQGRFVFTRAGRSKRPAAT